MVGLSLVLGMNIGNSFKFKNDFVVNDKISLVFSNKNVFVGNSELFVLLKWYSL